MTDTVLPIKDTEVLYQQMLTANALPAVAPDVVIETDNVHEAIKPFLGKWQANLSVSEPIDQHLINLGIGALKRMAIRHYASVTDFEMANHESVKSITHLPLGLKREAWIRLEGGHFERIDAETNDHWINDVWLDCKRGLLLQVRRAQSLGVLYDARGIYSSGKATGVPALYEEKRPMMLFRWTSEKNGEIVHADRWLVKIDS